MPNPRVGELYREDLPEYLLECGVNPDALAAFLKSPLYAFMKQYFEGRRKEIVETELLKSMDIAVVRQSVGRIDSIDDILALLKKLWEIVYPPRTETLEPDLKTELQRSQEREAEEAWKVQELARQQRENTEAPFGK